VGAGDREERKISFWPPPTITNSSFPLRKNCKYFWNRTLSCGQEEWEKTAKLEVSDKSDRHFHRCQWEQQQLVCAHVLGRRGGKEEWHEVFTMPYLNLFFFFFLPLNQIPGLHSVHASFKPHLLCLMGAGDNIIRKLELSEYAHQHIDSVHMCSMLQLGL